MTAGVPPVPAGPRRPEHPQQDGRGWVRRVAVYVGGVIALVGAAAGAVLAWTDRLNGWAALAAAAVAWTGITVAVVGRRRPAQHVQDGSGSSIDPGEPDGDRA